MVQTLRRNCGRARNLAVYGEAHAAPQLYEEDLFNSLNTVDKVLFDTLDAGYAGYAEGSRLN
jgi:hypothetical protein